MTTSNPITMKSAISDILTVHGVLQAFLDAEHYAVKIESSGFMPLTVERYGRTVIVAHYFEMNGDLVADPDMEFKIVGDTWAPVAIQHSTGAYSRVTTLKEGQDQESFAKVWARNLLNQGFKTGKLIRAEAS